MTTGSSLTRTDRNLWNAIVTESVANVKYQAFAQQALIEGHPEIAQIFQEVAGAENIHGINHLRVAGDVKSTDGEPAQRHRRRGRGGRAGVPADDSGRPRTRAAATLPTRSAWRWTGSSTT